MPSGAVSILTDEAQRAAHVQQWQVGVEVVLDRDRVDDEVEAGSQPSL
jgi:hypothetical protein